MIYYNSNTINEWNFGDDNIIKVYKHGAVCYYKITSGDTPTPVQEPCFAVVDDITQYQETEFEDVFDNTTEKWYKLNNLNQYEEYGVYGSGRSSASRLPQGYTEVEYIENTTMAYLDIDFKPNQDTRIVIDTQIVTSTNYGKIISSGQWDKLNGIQLQYEVGVNGTLLIDWGTSTRHYNTNINGDYNRHIYDWNKNNFYLDETLVASTTYGNFQSSCNLLVFMASSTSCSPTLSSHESVLGKLYSLKIYDNDVLSVDLVPCINSNNVAGVYDIVNDVFYTSPNGNNFIGGEPITPTDCVTTYEGKLTIDDGYEYIYSGGSWVNVGEVSGSSITIKSPEYIEKDSSHNGMINLDYVWKTNSKMQFKFYSTNNGGGSMIGEDGAPDNNDCRMFFASTRAYFDWGSSRINWQLNGMINTLYEYEYGNYYIKNMVSSTSKTGSTISTSRTNPLYLGQGSSDTFRTYYLKFYDGDTLVKDFIPWTDMNGNYGLFDKVSLSVYNVSSGSLTGSSNVTDVEVGGGYEYPLEYHVIQDPPNNLVFSSMAEAEAYECPWVGMNATIDGDKYIFSGDSQSGYEWVEKASKDSDFVIGDFNTFVSSSTEVTEGYYIIYSYTYDSSYANKNYLFSWNSGNTWNGYYTLGNMNHTDSNTSVPISSSEIIDDAVWELKDAGNGNFYIRNVATNKYWYYLGTDDSYGVPLTDNANDATPVNIQDWRNCLAFVEKQSGSNHPINRLYNYSYRYGWYAYLTTDGNNQYYMRKYVP